MTAPEDEPRAEMWVRCGVSHMGTSAGWTQMGTWAPWEAWKEDAEDTADFLKVSGTLSLVS